MTRDAVGPGQESVWDYPRPAICQAEPRRLEIVHRSRTIAATDTGVRTLETSHPPSYYFPPDSLADGCFRQSPKTSFCEWKGRAIYFDLVLGDVVLRAVAWSYPHPSPAFKMLRDHVAFYAAPFDTCLVGGEHVTPQPGGFYGGWITSLVAGPFKGIAGSQFW